MERWLAIAAALCVGATACALLLPDSDAQPDARGADAAADVEEDGAVGAASDAGLDVPLISWGDAGCPSGRGPTMIRNGNYCIDATEVTNEQYNQFLAAAVTPDAGPSTCWFKLGSDVFEPPPGQ